MLIEKGHPCFWHIRLDDDVYFGVGGLAGMLSLCMQFYRVN